MPHNTAEWYELPLNFSRMESQGSTAGLRTEITSKLGVIQGVFRRYSGNPHYQINIRAGQEWSPKHGLFSSHHTGFAVDIRTRDLPGGGVGPIALRVAEELKRALGKGYYVLLHKPPDPPQLHIQYNRGIRMSSPGDFPLQYA
jgi:hypothetical protein